MKYVKEINVIINEKNKIKKIDLLKILWQKCYDDEVTEEKKINLNNDLEKFDDIDDKIKYLRNELLQYLTHLSAELFLITGLIRVHVNENIKHFFWDHYLYYEIEKLKIYKPNT